MKKFINILLAVLILLPVGASAFVEERALPSPQDLTIDGEAVDIQGYNINDENYFFLRDLARLLKTRGINFSLWGDNKKIIIDMDSSYDEEDGHSIKSSNTIKKALAKTMTIHKQVNKELFIENIKVYNIDGYNFFRLRDMGELIGFKVDYDEAKNEAQIITKDTKKSEEITGRVVLGNERLIPEYFHLIENKNLGLITNQTGLDGNGVSTVEKLFKLDGVNLLACYSPEHGLDGKTKAGAYVESYVDPKYKLPVYSLYGKTREPSSEMLKDIDLLIFDIQDIGARTYTYISTMNYAMKAAKKHDIPFIVLDRPNPLGGNIVEGYMLEDKYKTFVGVDNMPMAHGMTVGELAQYFNRNIGVDLTVIPMKNYTRDMIWQETGLDFVQTSPFIPDIKSAFNYMATGVVGGTGLRQGKNFAWVGREGLDGEKLARALNSYNLPGLRFIAEDTSLGGGVRLEVYDYKVYNPQKVGTYILATVNLLEDIKIPREQDGKIPMFEKIYGTDRMGKALMLKRNPDDIVRDYQFEVDNFKKTRQEYLIYK